MLEVVRRISARLAVTRAEGAAVAFFAAVALRQPLGAALHRFAARMQSQSVRYSFRCLPSLRDSSFRANVVGVMVGLPQPLKLQRRCTPALMLRGFTELRLRCARERLCVRASISSSSASGNLFTRLGEPSHSCPVEVYFRGAMSTPTGQAGAPRGR